MQPGALHLAVNVPRLRGVTTSERAMARAAVTPCARSSSLSVEMFLDGVQCSRTKRGPAQSWEPRPSNPPGSLTTLVVIGQGIATSEPVCQVLGLTSGEFFGGFSHSTLATTQDAVPPVAVGQALDTGKFDVMVVDREIRATRASATALRRGTSSHLGLQLRSKL